MEMTISHFLYMEFLPYLAATAIYGTEHINRSANHALTNNTPHELLIILATNPQQQVFYFLRGDNVSQLLRCFRIVFEDDSFTAIDNIE